MTMSDATDASVIVAALRAVDGGCADLPPWVMPGLMFAAFNGYVASGEPPTLTMEGRRFLNMFGPCYPETETTPCR